MMIIPTGTKEAIRRFFIVASFIGLCVCGALMLFFAVEGYWKEAGMYLVFFLCNAWTFETKRRKK
jgi:hypothetical protein